MGREKGAEGRAARWVMVSFLFVVFPWSLSI